MFGLRFGVPIEVSDNGPSVDLARGSIIAQRFVLPFDETLEEVRVIIGFPAGGLPAGGIECRIHNDASGLPGTVIASSTQLDELPDVPGPVSFVGFNVQLRKGIPYWFSMTNRSDVDGIVIGNGSRTPLFLCDHYQAYSYDGISWYIERRMLGTLVLSTRMYGLSRADGGSISIGNSRNQDAIGFTVRNGTLFTWSVIGVQSACISPGGWYAIARVTDSTGGLVSESTSAVSLDRTAYFPSVASVSPGQRISVLFQPDECLVESLTINIFRETDSRIARLLASRLFDDSFTLEKRSRITSWQVSYSRTMPIASLLLRI